MANTFTKGYADGSALTTSMLDTALGTVQPSLPNMALSTTGTSSQDILQSTGANLAPQWVTPNTFAATITSSGSNAIVGVLSSVAASVANLIGNAMGASGAQAIATTMSTVGANIVVGLANSQSTPAAALSNNIVAALSSVVASTANLIHNGITSCSAAVANLTINAISSCSSTSANIIADAVVRPYATTVSHLGVAFSGLSGTFETTSTSGVAVTNLSVTITTSGRPVVVCLVPSRAETQTTNTSLQSFIGVLTNSAVGFVSTNIILVRDITNISSHNFSSIETAAVQTQVSLGCVNTVDIPAAGTYTYTVFQSVQSTSITGRVYNAQLVAYEL